MFEWCKSEKAVVSSEDTLAKVITMSGIFIFSLGYAKHSWAVVVVNRLVRLARMLEVPSSNPLATKLKLFQATC